jgi:NAD(P)-dependent dehydrogenase (short-subunit alcohol dehydrogenase family)
LAGQEIVCVTPLLKQFSFQHHGLGSTAIPLEVVIVDCGEVGPPVPPENIRTMYETFRQDGVLQYGPSQAAVPRGLRLDRSVVECTVVKLNEKTVLITAGLGAIAEHILKTLSAAGATLVITDQRSEADAQTVLQGWGLSACTYLPMSITEPTSVEQAVAEAFTRHPGINVALGHAGGTGIFPFETCERARFDQIVTFNFLGQTWFAREVLRHWRQNACPGHLIFTSSYTARIPMAGIAAYTASKAALEMFARNLALEYAPHGIRVNCVAPGNVAAGSSQAVYENDPAYRAWVDRVSPLGRRNSPQAIANAFLYLCSPLADEIDGQVLQVDAGVGLPKLG